MWALMSTVNTVATPASAYTCAHFSHTTATRPLWRPNWPRTCEAGASGLCWAVTAPMRMHA